MPVVLRPILLWLFVVIAEINGRAVKSLSERVIVYDYWMFADMKNKKQEPKQELKQVKKNSPSETRTITVTERHTVEWYMQHTIDALNKGVEYGEQKLREVCKRKRV